MQRFPNGRRRLPRMENLQQKQLKIAPIIIVKNVDKDKDVGLCTLKMNILKTLFLVATHLDHQALPALEATMTRRKIRPSNSTKIPTVLLNSKSRSNFYPMPRHILHSSRIFKRVEHRVNNLFRVPKPNQCLLYFSSAISMDHN